MINYNLNEFIYEQKIQLKNKQGEIEMFDVQYTCEHAQKVKEMLRNVNKMDHLELEEYAVENCGLILADAHEEILAKHGQYVVEDLASIILNDFFLKESQKKMSQIKSQAMTLQKELKM